MTIPAPFSIVLFADLLKLSVAKIGSNRGNMALTLGTIWAIWNFYQTSLCNMFYILLTGISSNPG